MMWHWLVSSLADGATIVLYDGSPLPTTPRNVQWRLRVWPSASDCFCSVSLIFLCISSEVFSRSRGGFEAVEFDDDFSFFIVIQSGALAGTNMPRSTRYKRAKLNAQGLSGVPRTGT